MRRPTLYHGVLHVNQLLEFSMEISPPQNPPGLDLPAKVAMIPGNSMIDEAKMTGMTPAVLTFSGMWLDCPPIVRRPTTFREYCTGMERSESFRRTTSTTRAMMMAMMMIPASTPRATVRPLTKFS